MPTLDLSGADLDRVRRLVSRYAPDAEVWAYGSRVDGSNHAASDLDLVLRNPIDLSHPQARLFDLREAIAESAIPILVDVLDWARLPRRAVTPKSKDSMW